MKIIKSVESLKDYIRDAKASCKSIGFVPTMGFLHEGHLSLIHRARVDADVVVVSIFVNPTQFGPNEDYKRYPRNLGKDCKLAEGSGVDVVFAPRADRIYPPLYETYVDVVNLSKKLCGVSRPGHFRGVATIVLKLFNIVNPDAAYFGQKDMQQAIIIRKMVRDLALDVRIEILPIVREPDGLAMSSRNSYLKQKERQDAVILYKAVMKANDLIRQGVRESKKIIKIMERIINDVSSAKIDYLSIVDMETLQDVDKIETRVLVAAAIWIGRTRLIDNIIVDFNKIHRTKKQRVAVD